MATFATITPNDSVSQSTNGTESVLTYVEDTLHGQIYTDNITAGILSSTNQTFVSVDNSHLHSYDQMPMDGADEFTIYLKRHQALQTAQSERRIFWNFETTNFSIGNEVVSETMGYGLVCHATANIGLIMKVWHKLLDAVKAAYNKTLKMNTVKCSTVSRLPDLVFNISGKLYPVPAYQYINKIPGEDQICELAVEMSPEEVYILGNPFLRTYCSYFDYAGQRIGFSRAKQPDFK
uniref:Peptidase A1 domain-containing protein n=1 Tax=Ditylenchus dipsaci TaxID=166011 RepID=A0A915E235_9BILA